MEDKKLMMSILDEAFFVRNAKDHYINTNNGVLNDEHLQREKKHLLSEGVSYLADEVVNTLQHYPHNDISKVELEVNMVVLKENHYLMLKKLIENLYE